jgi:hypothetical protein
MKTVEKKKRRTQSTVWYLCLPIFEKYKVKLSTRGYFTSRIKAVCERIGVTREELGIIAKPRATMYFNGKWTSVSYDAIDDLARNGTDIIFIEKKGIVEVFCEYADDYGIALVDTQGFLTDYAKDLVKAGGISGANVAVVSDYDASGIKLAYDAGTIPRLGVDQEMLDYFGLDKNNLNLSVPMKSEKDVITPIKNLVSSDVLEFLKYKKVEIDAVLAAVGNERFWEYLVHKLLQHYPTRDYTRVVKSSPEVSNYYPVIVYNLEIVLGKYNDLILQNEALAINDELKEVEGFIENINQRRQDIDKRYRAIVNKDKTLKEINDKLTIEIQPLIDRLNGLIELKGKGWERGD